MQRTDPRMASAPRITELACSTRPGQAPTWAAIPPARYTLCEAPCHMVSTYVQAFWMLLRSSSRGSSSSNGSVAAAAELFCNAPKVQLGNRTPFHFKGKRNWYRHLKGARGLASGASSATQHAVVCSAYMQYLFVRGQLLFSQIMQAVG